MYQGAYSGCASARVKVPWQPQTGFTLVQIAMALVVLGILAGLAVSKWSQFSRKQALVAEGKNLLAFMQEGRSYGAKKSLQIGIHFDPSQHTCWLFTDGNRNASMDAGEGIRSLKFSQGITFGLAQSGPSSGPQGVAAPASGIGGNWVQGWIAATDLSVSPSVGAVYLHHSALPVFTLCLNGTAVSQKVALNLWNGSEWIIL